MAKVLVVGGTGFIGSRTVDALLSQGHEVTVMTRHMPDSKQLTLRDKLSYVEADLYQLTETQCLIMMQSVHTVVFSAGVDERVSPVGDAYSFYVTKNIEPMHKLMEAAKEMAVEKFIVMNSIFSYLERTQPELNLTQHHPYICSRVDQRDYALSKANKEFKVYVFEVPYVFGLNDQGKTQWQKLIDFSRSSPAVIFTKGGANMLNVKTLANAVVACVENKVESGTYPIGDENLTWQQLFERLHQLDGGYDKGQVKLPTDSFDKLSKLGGFFKDLLNIHSGLDNRYMSDIVTNEMFFDAKSVQEELGFTSVALDEALVDCLEACEKKSAIKGLLDIALA